MSRAKTSPTLLSSLNGLPTPVVYAYAVFSAAGFAVFHLVAEREPSSTLTLSSLAQCLGISLLWMQLWTGQGAHGISVKALTLDAVAICFRLSSTLVVEGYLPNSRDGDYLYQFFDVCAVLMILLLLRRVLMSHPDTYQFTEDACPIAPMLLVCFLLAAVLHGDMDDNPVLDTLWMAGLLTSVIAVLPQFWLLQSSGGQVGAYTSHYVASMAFSRFLAGCFAFMAWEHLSCEPYFGEFQHFRITVMGVYILHAIIHCDFFWNYMRTMMNGGICSTMSLGYGEVQV